MTLYYARLNNVLDGNVGLKRKVSVVQSENNRSNYFRAYRFLNFSKSEKATDVDCGRKEFALIGKLYICSAIVVRKGSFDLYRHRNLRKWIIV